MIAFVWLFVAVTDINIFDGLQHWKSLLLRKAMETVVLLGVYPNCSSVDFKSEYFTSQVRDLPDNKHLMCFCREECTQTEEKRVVSSLDGSIQKTCTKVSGADEYVCVSQSARRAFYQGAEQFRWSSDWDPIIPNIENGNIFTRRLCLDDGGEAQCVAEEKIHLRYLVAHLNVSDDAITASAVYRDMAVYAAKGVRLGPHSADHCAWAA